MIPYNTNAYKYILGILYSHLKSYTIVFLCSGAPPIIGAILMCGIYCARTQANIDNSKMELENVESLAPNYADKEKIIH